MGLDVYVGSLTRYYARDWETIVQRLGREHGFEVQMIGAPDESDAITDPESIRESVCAWRDMLTAGLGEALDAPLDWDESNESPYFTDKPAWDCYTSLKLWGAYAEQTELIRPTAFVSDLASDEAYTKCTEPDFPSEFAQLLRDVEIWLPHDFEFTFRAPDVGGREMEFGSAVALRRQLDELNRRTWDADATTLA